MDRMPIGMAVCLHTGGAHAPVHNTTLNGSMECMDCELRLIPNQIYIPERDQTVTLWLSETIIYEEPF